MIPVQKRQRMTIQEAAEELAEVARGERVLVTRSIDFRSPFPPTPPRAEPPGAVKRWRSRLYTAVQQMEIDHERDTRYPRSVIHLRWNDVMRWYRDKYRTVEAL